MVQLLRKYVLNTFWLCLFAVHYCLGAAGDVKTGIGVFDTLYIAGSHGMAVHGDVFLEGAHILGEGEIQLRGDGDNRIVSHRSEINHLTVSTRGKVRLEGELAVNKSLTIHSGVFDLTDGILDVSDSATVRKFNGSQIKSGQIVSKPFGKRAGHESDKAPKALCDADSGLAGVFVAKSVRAWVSPECLSLKVYLSPDYLPPEAA